MLTLLDKIFILYFLQRILALLPSTTVISNNLFLFRPFQSQMTSFECYDTLANSATRNSTPIYSQDWKSFHMMLVSEMMLQITDINTVKVIPNSRNEVPKLLPKKAHFAKIFLQLQPSKLTRTAVPDSVIVIGNIWGLKCVLHESFRGQRHPTAARDAQCAAPRHPQQHPSPGS